MNAGEKVSTNIEPNQSSPPQRRSLRTGLVALSGRKLYTLSVSSVVFGQSDFWGLTSCCNRHRRTSFKP